MSRRTVASQLEGAELWERTSQGHVRAVPVSRPVMVAGWEDADSFCAAVCSNDAGLAFCRRCPETVVNDVLRTGRASRARCNAGVDLLAFPAPRGSRRQVAVLRAGPPTPAAAARVAGKVRIPAPSLRRAAREAETPDPGASLRAARRLRTASGLTAWRLMIRQHAADRRRTTTAALAQMIVTSEEYLRLYQESRRQLQEIERQRRRLDDLARETTASAASERARIAHRIHDTAAQSMVSAFRYLEAVKATATAEPAALRARLEDASERLSTAIREVRAVLNDLIPPGLDELGLARVLKTRVAALAAETGIEGHVTGTLPRLEATAEQALYGMTLEAVTNAVRHAQAARITVELGTRRGRAVIEVSDDGVGFDPVAAARARRADGGLGLLGIVRQATWLGGSTSVRSRPGAGSRIRISVPIERSPRKRGRPGAVGASADGAAAGIAAATAAPRRTTPAGAAAGGVAAAAGAAGSAPAEAVAPAISPAPARPPRGAAAPQAASPQAASPQAATPQAATPQAASPSSSPTAGSPARATRRRPAAPNGSVAPPRDATSEVPA